VPIWRQRLHNLQNHSAAENNTANENQPSWVSKEKGRSKKRKRNEVLKESIAPNRRMLQDRRELEIYSIDKIDPRQSCVSDKGQRCPGGNGDETMNHVAVITEKGIRRKGEAADVAKMPAAPCLAIEIVAGDLGRSGQL
jgi:hypothetical protein